MIFDISLVPTTFDQLHAILVGTTLMGVVIALFKKPKTIEKTVEKQVDKIVEVEKPVEKIVEIEKIVEVEKVVEKVVKVESNLTTNNSDSALQLLSILQQEARLVDFLNENLTDFSDEEVGAAARVIHSGGKKALDNYFTLSPVRTEDEETSIVIDKGFDSQEIRLMGNVTGTAPYTGNLVHKGWKVTQVDLPQLAEGYKAHIVAPAEVEL